MLSPTGILYSRRSHLLLGVPISHDRRILYRMIRPATLWCSPVYLPERPRTPMRTLEGGVDQQHRRCRCPHIDLCCSDREPLHLWLMREERKEDFDAHRLSIQDLDSAFLLPVPSLSLHASSHTSMSHQWELLASCGGLPLCSAKLSPTYSCRRRFLTHITCRFSFATPVAFISGLKTRTLARMSGRL